MQINATNMLMSLQGAASTGLAGGILDVNGVVGNPAQSQQFAGLLSPNGAAAPNTTNTLGANFGVADPFALMNAGLDKLNASKDNAELVQNTPIGDIAISPDSGIVAIPALPVFIDQPVEQNANNILSKDQIIAGTAEKKMVWEEYDTANNIQFKNSGKAVASELGNAQEKYSAHETAQAKLAVVDDSKGKIDVSSLQQEPNGEVDQAEFAAAVAKLVQDKQKSVKADISPVVKASEEKTAELTKLALNEKSAQIEEQFKQPAEAVKITAKVVDVKNEKLHSEAEVDQVASRLQELDTHLRSRDFNLIRSARESLNHPSVQEQVNIQISQMAKDGINNIKINLIPEELGKVDVNLEIDREGKTQIRIIAERGETLDLLRRDAQQLTKSLADAGLNTDAGNLQFSLRESNDGRNFANDNNGSNDNNKQQVAAANSGYSRFSRINEQELMLSIGTKGLNILV